MKKIIKNIFRILYYLNIKTLYFNFKYLDFNTALRLPFFISRHVRLKTAQGNVSIETSEIFSGMIRIGYGDVGAFDKHRSRSVWDVKGNVKFKGGAIIGHGSKIVVGQDGKLAFGNQFTINAESTIICYFDVEFGNDCLLSWDILIMDTDFHKIYSTADDIPLNQNKQIRIGDHCWIGCRSIILKGTTLAQNSIVAANSTITNSRAFENKPNVVLGGNPVSVLRDNVNWRP